MFNKPLKLITVSKTIHTECLDHIFTTFVSEFVQLVYHVLAQRQRPYRPVHFYFSNEKTKIKQLIMIKKKKKRKTTTDAVQLHTNVYGQRDARF